MMYVGMREIDYGLGWVLRTGSTFTRTMNSIRYVHFDSAYQFLCADICSWYSAATESLFLRVHFFDNLNFDFIGIETGNH